MVTHLCQEYFTCVLPLRVKFIWRFASYCVRKWGCSFAVWEQLWHTTLIVPREMQLPKASALEMWLQFCSLGGALDHYTVRTIRNLHVGCAFCIELYLLIESIQY